MINIKIAWFIEMEELDIEDGNKAEVTIDKSSFGLIGSQKFFGDKSVGFFEDAYEFKEAKNPVQFDEKRQDKDHVVMIVEDSTDLDVQGSQGVGRYEEPLVLTLCQIMNLS